MHGFIFSDDAAPRADNFFWTHTPLADSILAKHERNELSMTGSGRTERVARPNLGEEQAMPC